jgi:hypothetical protein
MHKAKAKRKRPCVLPQAASLDGARRLFTNCRQQIEKGKNKMIRSNSKKAIENIRAYILENVTAENYESEHPTTFEEAAAFIMDTFKAEHWNSANIRRYYGSEQNSFTAWCQGLPSALDTCYYYNRSAVDDLGAILEESEEEKGKYSEEQAESLLTWLIYRELKKATR